MRKLVLLPIIVVFLATCSNYVYDLRGKFDESVKKYNALYRWNDLESASLFAADPVRDAFVARAKAFRNVKVVDYRVLSTQYDGEKRKATVDVDFDYYFISTTRVKTLHDTQEWVYIDQPGIKGWRLMSLLPEFK
jgi:hypothetical protein